MSKIDYKKMMQMLRIQRYQEIADYDKVVGLGVESMWRELCEKIGDTDVDPTEIYDAEIESLRNIEYSMKLMNICCLSETWEQDLYNFLKEKGLVSISSNDYKNTKRLFESAYPTCLISNYPLIEEMRALVNAIKHGEGNSFTNIRRLTGDAILADSNIGVADENGVVTRKKQIEFDNNTLTSRTLNVDRKLQAYSSAVISFWEDVFIADKEKESTTGLE